MLMPYLVDSFLWAEWLACLLLLILQRTGEEQPKSESQLPMFLLAIILVLTLLRAIVISTRHATNGIYRTSKMRQEPFTAQEVVNDTILGSWTPEVQPNKMKEELAK